MKKTILLQLILSLYFSCALYSQTVTDIFHHLTVEDGLTDGNIRTIAQDKNGFIWIGTQSGLNRYDGYTIKTFQKKIKDINSISDDLINDLYFANDNKLWIATASGLTIYDMEHDTFIRWEYHENDPQSLPASFVRSVTGDSDGNVWMATENRITRYSATSRQLQHYPGLKEPGLPAVFEIMFDADNDLWISISGGLYVIKHDSTSAVRIPLPVKFKNKTVSNNLFGIGFDPRGFIWCSNFSGLLFRIHKDTYEVTVFDQLMKQGAAQNFCTAIAADTDGRLWFATRFTSLAMYQSTRDTFKFYRHHPFLNVSVSAPTVQTVFCDRSGMVWAGTSGRGADRFHPDRQYFKILYPGVGQQSGLPSGWVRCFTETAAKQLLIGTAEGLTQYDPVSQSLLTYRNDPANMNSLSFNSIRALLTDHEGTVWIGTAAGLNVIEPGSKSVQRLQTDVKHPFSLITSFFYSIIEDKHHNIWVAGNRGVELTDASHQRFYNRHNDSLLKKLPSGSVVWCTFPDSKGNVWIGYHYEGLVKLNYAGGEIQHFKATGDSLGLPHGNVNDIGEDHNGFIWLGTNGGLCRLDPVKNLFVTFTTAEGLPSNTVSGILIDEKNRVWMATNRGLTVYDQELNTFRTFTVDDGLPTNQFNNQKAYRTGDGYFCYATMNGALIFHPDSIRTNPQVPPVNITRFSVFGGSKDFGKAIEDVRDIVLSWKENFFTIDFAALNFDQPGKNEYACQLIGFDREMQFLGNRNSVNYTNVPPGNYTLHVMAANNDGVWNREGIHVQLQIIPPFWQTTWFRILAIVVLSLLVYGLYRYRIHLIRKREAAKTEINKRIAELRLSALRTQMNPHFIFNSISSIQNLIALEKKNDSMDYIGKFSRLIRLILHQAENNSIALSEEVDMLELYLEMETLRFERSFSWKIEVEEALRNRDPEIPTMIIQPIVENAVIHGLLNKDEKGELLIRFILKETFMECIVEDDGVGRRAAEEIKKGKLFQHNSVATRVTGERLEILNKIFDMPTAIQTIDLMDSAGRPSGTRVVIDLPMIEN
ncbi:MAG TPA: two-component regulator propeller domain-containing protein [Chitinophagales bacterium]|nr:two-component regulator propeller domain-containing protein [Chitinophagales bacterium]